MFMQLFRYLKLYQKILKLKIFEADIWLVKTLRIFKIKRLFAQLFMNKFEQVLKFLKFWKFQKQI